MSRRLGFLGPAIVLVGVAASALGVWWMVHARSQATDFLDVLALDGESALAVRREHASNRNFLELRHHSGKVAWQALVPPYAGRPGSPGLAASRTAASVRVVRDERAEVFGLAMRNAAKLGGLKLAQQRPRDPAGFTLPAAVTLHDGLASYELVGGRGADPWAYLASIDLETGRERWHVDLGTAPITGAGLVDGSLWLRQGASVRVLSTADGSAQTGAVAQAAQQAAQAQAQAEATPGVRILTDSPALRVVFDRAARALQIQRGGRAPTTLPWPPGALEPWPYHLAGGRLWVVFPDHLQTLVVDETAPVGATLARP